MFSGASGSGILSWIKSRALVGDADNQRIAGRLERRRDVLARVVRIPVQHGVDRRLANRHGDVRNRVFVETGPLGYSARRLSQSC